MEHEPHADIASPAPELADVGRLARRAVRVFVRAARGSQPSPLSLAVAGHLGAQAERLPIVEETWPGYDAVNVQVGLDAWLAEAGRRHDLVGVTGFQRMDFGLAELLASAVPGHHRLPLDLGNVARVNLPSGPDGQVRACVECGVYLVSEEGRQTVLLLRGASPQTGQPRVRVQTVSTDPDFAAVVTADLRRLVLEHNVFRGQVLSFGGEVFGHGQAFLRFHSRPQMDAGELILDPQVLEQIRRQVVLVARHKEALLSSGQHLKRGLLLYGPPGVGKTHTVRFLTASLPETTVIELTGPALGMIAEACSVARSLQPSMIVVEDVDLIAESRGMHPGQHPLLFQLMNEMDGLAEDSDVVFVLTTNRADLLEPALAARPGRVDQAVELILPDRDARARLFRLYSRGMRVDSAPLDAVLERTAGVTASFIKELLRRGALIAAERGHDGADQLDVTEGDLETALDELLDTRNAMTRILLGAAPAGAAPDTPS